MTVEEWRVIEDLPRYEVSSLGQVRNKATGRLMRQFPQNTRGYLAVGLVSVQGQGNRPYMVNQLVCRAFHGAPDPERGETERVQWLNGKVNDNRAENLCWYVTQKHRSGGIRKDNVTHKVDNVLSGEAWMGILEASQVTCVDDRIMHEQVQLRCAASLSVVRKVLKARGYVQLYQSSHFWVLPTNEEEAQPEEDGKI